MRTPSVLVSIALGATLLAGCAEPPVSTPTADLSARLASVSPARWSALGSRRIYFAHQSVGGNVVEGIASLLEGHPELPLRLVRSSRPDTVDGGAILHDYVGDNGDPAGKTSGFSKIVLAAGNQPIDIGLQKYCYADFNKDTDVPAVFASYEQQIEKLRQLRPQLQIVHVTAPLLQERFSLKDLARAVLGRTTTAAKLGKVRQYNAMLRMRYAGIDPVFDLASVETGGTAAGVKEFHADESLAARYATPDGGHLNPLGQRVAAAELLVFLASLPGSSMPPRQSSSQTGEHR